MLLKESIKKLNIKENGVFIDATFGRGGHSKEILKKLGSKGILIALDRDKTAIEYAKKNIKDKRLIMIHSNFANLKEHLIELSLLGKVDGILVDLGVSSPQLDNPERGFSFQKSGPLDMRMDQENGIPVSKWLNDANEQEIANVLYQYGEEKKSRIIAKAIKNKQQYEKIISTNSLVNVITSVIPFRKHKHPATRSFQALRIFINKELDSLNTLLNDIYEILNIGGRFVAISFHSLEDRIIKRFINKNSKADIYPKGLPIMEKDIEESKFISLGKFIASKVELEFNIRARSAIGRVCQKNN